MSDACKGCAGLTEWEPVDDMVIRQGGLCEVVSEFVRLLHVRIVASRHTMSVRHLHSDPRRQAVVHVSPVSMNDGFSREHALANMLHELLRFLQQVAEQDVDMFHERVPVLLDLSRCQNEIEKPPRVLESVGIVFQNNALVEARAARQTWSV